MIVIKTTIKGLKKGSGSVKLVNRVLTILAKNLLLAERVGAIKWIDTRWTAGVTPIATVDIETSHGELTLELTRSEYNALRGAETSYVGAQVQAIRTTLGCAACKK